MAKQLPCIKGYAIGVPKYQVSQTLACETAKQATKADENKQTLLDKIYANTCIENRYMAVSDFEPNHSEERLYGDEGFAVPLHKRHKYFEKYAAPLVTQVCKEALDKSGLDTSQIGKVIVVTSTGFFAPSLDCVIIKELGLSKSVDRCTIGFMGCAAAMNGIRVGRDYAMSHQGKAAMVCCVELSSTHITFNKDINDSIIHALFADGCATMIIQAVPESTVQPGMLTITDDHSVLAENTQDGITLSINATSITCTLSKHLSNYIVDNIEGFVTELCAKNNLTRQHVDLWTIHPGGPRILEAVEKGLQLTKQDTKASWETLAKYGNMLSPSFVFVLDHQLKQLTNTKEAKTFMAISFAPGVGVEGLLLVRH